MTKVTCQMKCTDIEQGEADPEISYVRLTADFDTEGVWEDFTEYTPSGECELMIDGSTTKAAEFFKAGEVYKMTFEKAEPLDA